MSDDVRPALTPEEWRRVLGNEPIDGLLQRPFDRDDVAEDGRPLAAITSAMRHILEHQWRPEAIMALAHQLLPERDPQRITRQYVRDLLTMAGAWDALAADPTEEPATAVSRVRAGEQCRRIAALLAALLPPEQEPAVT